MKLLTTVLLGATLLSNTAIASDRAEVAGSLAADLLYHCADERSDYAYLDFLRPITKNFTELQKPVFDVAGRITTQVMSEEVNINCDFAVELTKSVLK